MVPTIVTGKWLFWDLLQFLQTIMNTTKSRDTLLLDAENPMLHSPDDDSESADTSSENLPSRETKSCKLMKKMKL